MGVSGETAEDSVAVNPSATGGHGSAPAAGAVHLPPVQGAFCRRLVHALRQKCRVQPESNLVVAVSGGADSTALLLGLVALARRPFLAYRLTVAHVHHHLRGEADQEAAGVQALAEHLGVAFQRLDVNLDNPAPTGSLSASLRRARYAMLAELISKLGADALVTAHHGDDQLETILMGLMRGAGLHGMAGMAWRRKRWGIDVIRPLLSSTHAECVAVCRECGVNWFEDSSNDNMNQLRNRIRAQVIPAIAAIAPDLNRRVSRLCEQLQSTADFVDLQVDQLAHQLGNEGSFDRAALTGLNDVVLGALLRRAAMRLGVHDDSMNFDLIASAIDSIRGESCCEMDWPDGVRLVMDDTRVFLCRCEPGAGP